MRTEEITYSKRIGRFFYLGMSYTNLMDHFKTSRILKRDFNYDLFEQAQMVPFEREITIILLNQEIEAQNKSKQSSGPVFDPHGMADRP